MQDADKKALLARQLEEWINHMVKEQADGNNEQIPMLIKQGFDTMIQANIDYHSSMSETSKDKDGRHVIECYHDLMTQVYQKFLCDK